MQDNLGRLLDFEEARLKPLGRVAFALLLATLTVAQSGTGPRVLVPLLVTDSHHRLVDGLLPEALTIREHKTPVTDVKLLRGADLPLQLGILIDTSNSERDGNINEILEGAKSFVNDVLRGPEDRAFFLTFATTINATDWLKKEQLSGVTVNLKLGGATALYDAVAAACRERMGPRNADHPTRRILVLISDGDDNQSHITRAESLADVLHFGVVMFTISTQVIGHSGRGDRILERWATITGGRFFTDMTRKDVPKAFAQIKAITEGMYYASYVPPPSKDGVHEIDVKPAPKEKLEVSYPEKYVWP